MKPSKIIDKIYGNDGNDGKCMKIWENDGKCIKTGLRLSNDYT